MTVSVNNCCVLNIGKVLCSTHVSIDGTVLPVVEFVRDLGIIVSRDLSPSLHISDIVAKARRRSAAIHRTYKVATSIS